MTEALLVGFRRLGLQGRPSDEKARSPRAPLGEGAALVVLERSGAAIARKMEPLAEIAGYGTAFAPPKHAASLVHASTEAVEQAIVDALADAHAAGAEIDLVVSGLSGLSPFDEAELGAIRRVVGESVPVTAPKLDLGETLGASSALAILAAIAHAHDDAPVKTVSGKARAAIRTTLVTALGYYGNASALVMRHPSR
jgi:3-oxoacyl-(acyl-carrier-protein) synthase